MKTNITHIIRERRKGVRKSIIGLSVAFACMACEKSEDANDNGTAINVSENGLSEEFIDALELSVDGGKDTIYVFSPSDIQMIIQPSEVEGWVKVVDETYLSDIQATRVILEAEPLEGDLARREGILNIGSQEPYSRKFLKLVQGYGARYTNDFSWLRYGNGNPLQQSNGVRIAQWNPAQLEQGWTSTVMEGQTVAFLYGKNDYVQIGAEEVGANLLSPMISSVERDSLMVLTFNAVAFVSEEGIPDNNKLTIKLTGGEFEGGEISQVLELSHFDKESALLTSKMWEDTWFALEIYKPQANPFSSVVQIEFISGDGTAAQKNRVFLDNVNLYVKAQFEDENR